MSGNVESGKQSRRLFAICAGLFLLTLAVYWPTLSHDFVNYDDPDYVTSNSFVQNGLSCPNLVWAFTTSRASNWHPLTWISHMVDCQLFGLKPAGHHLTNVLFHAVNALLLFCVLREMTRATWPSAFVAALFAWHPLHVESVAWISERKDVLSTFFWLLTMLAYSKFTVFSASSASAKSKIYYSLALLFCALGLLCKPMLVTLPFVLLLMDYWPLGRMANPQKGTCARGVPLSRLALEKAPFLLLAVVSSWITFAVQKKGGAVTSLEALSIGERTANALVSYLRYVGKIFWPQNLSVLYPHPGSWPFALVLAAAGFLIVVSVLVVLVRRTRPYLVVGWFWFLGTLVPVIGLVQVGVQSMADRYTYVPAIGLFIMVAWGVSELLAGVPQRAGILSVGAGAALAACWLTTYAQVRYWQNSETLFRHTVQVTQNNYLAYNNLGFYQYNHGQTAEAMTNYIKSIEINPNYADAQNNLGHALVAKGKNAEAITHLEAALRINPRLVEAHNNIGNALSNLGKLDEAITHYEAALRYRPDDEDAHNNLGIARAMQGRFDEAVALLTEAIRLKPSDAGAHGNLGNTFAVQHKLDEAVKQFQIALQLNPSDAQARNNLGNVLTEQGKLDEARENYLTALRLNADNPEANFNLGMVLLRQGKTDEAKARFTEALRLRPDYTEPRRQLESIAAAEKH